MMRPVVITLLVALLASCGPPPAPEYIVKVQDLAGSKAGLQARDQAPSAYKKGTDALMEALDAHASGDDEMARNMALQASILLKTAIAQARKQAASTREAKAKTRIQEASDELERFTSLRLDTQRRYLLLAAFHDEQTDLAKNLLSKFESDKKALAQLQGAKKEQWLASEHERLGQVLTAARGSVIASRALGCEALLPSETEETVSAVEHAAEAMDDEWIVLRPLVDDAALRADRLLVHTRAMTQPDPLTNPATDEEAVARFVKALEGTDAMVSATRRGILVSIASPWSPGEGKLSAQAASILETLAGATGPTPHPLLVEAWMMQDCPGTDCVGESQAIADAASDALVSAGEQPSSITATGWGDAPFGQEGHCLVDPCPGGRLDVVILTL